MAPVKDSSLAYWRTVADNSGAMNIYESHLFRAALCANPEQLEELARIRPNLVTVVKEKRGLA